MTAKKKAESVEVKTVPVFMTGNSRGLKKDQKVDVDEASAKRLIRNGHAISAEDFEQKLEADIRSGD